MGDRVGVMFSFLDWAETRIWLWKLSLVVLEKSFEMWSEYWMTEV